MKTPSKLFSIVCIVCPLLGLFLWLGMFLWLGQGHSRGRPKSKPLPWAQVLSTVTGTLEALPGPKSNLTHFTRNFFWLTRDFPYVTFRISSKNLPFRCENAYILSLNWCINMFSFINLSFFKWIDLFFKNIFFLILFNIEHLVCRKLAH